MYDCSARELGQLFQVTRNGHDVNENCLLLRIVAIG